MSDKSEINHNYSNEISQYPVCPSHTPTKKPHKLGIMKNRLISTQKDANASIVVIVMTTRHSEGDKY